MANTYYIDGEFVDAAAAVLPVDDLALLRGYGIFDFLRTYNGRPFYLSSHIARLFRSAKRIGLALPWKPGEIEDVVRETLGRNDHEESSIRILVTGGSSADGLRPDGRSRLLVLVTPAQKPPGEWYDNGIKLSTCRTERLFPDAKSTNYIAGILALEKARREGAVESLYVSRDNRVLECTTSNFFIFRGDTLVTPGTGILSGITREVVLSLTDGVFDMDTRDITVDELAGIDEAFITSSVKEVLPVVRVDDVTIKTGKPGHRTRKLMALFADFVAAYGRGDQYRCPVHESVPHQ